VCLLAFSSHCIAEVLHAAAAPSPAAPAAAVTPVAEGAGGVEEGAGGLRDGEESMVQPAEDAPARGGRVRGVKRRGRGLPQHRPTGRARRSCRRGLNVDMPPGGCFLNFNRRCKYGTVMVSNWAAADSLDFVDAVAPHEVHTLGGGQPVHRLPGVEYHNHPISAFADVAAMELTFTTHYGPGTAFWAGMLDGRRMLLHCEHGHNRSMTIALMILAHLGHSVADLVAYQLEFYPECSAQGATPTVFPSHPACQMAVVNQEGAYWSSRGGERPAPYEAWSRGRGSRRRRAPDRLGSMPPPTRPRMTAPAVELPPASPSPAPVAVNLCTLLAGCPSACGYGREADGRVADGVSGPDDRFPVPDMGYAAGPDTAVQGILNGLTSRTVDPGWVVVDMTGDGSVMEHFGGHRLVGDSSIAVGPFGCEFSDAHTMVCIPSHCCYHLPC
jgi:hypothetical protein